MIKTGAHLVKLIRVKSRFHNIIGEDSLLPCNILYKRVLQSYDAIVIITFKASSDHATFLKDINPIVRITAAGCYIPHIIFWFFMQMLLLNPSNRCCWSRRPPLINTSHVKYVYGTHLYRPSKSRTLSSPIILWTLGKTWQSWLLALKYSA